MLKSFKQVQTNVANKFLETLVNSTLVLTDGFLILQEYVTRTTSIRVAPIRN